jgi:hypothetical protein
VEVAVPAGDGLWKAKQRVNSSDLGRAGNFTEGERGKANVKRVDGLANSSFRAPPRFFSRYRRVNVVGDLKLDLIYCTERAAPATGHALAPLRSLHNLATAHAFLFPRHTVDGYNPE